METIRSRDNQSRYAPTSRRSAQGSSAPRFETHLAPARTTAEPGSGPHPHAERRWWQSPRFCKLLIVIADAITLLIALSIAMVLARFSGRTSSVRNAEVTRQIALLAVPVWLFALTQVRAYQSRFIAARAQEFRRLALASIAGAASLLVISDIWRRIAMERDFVLFAFLIGLGLLTIEREIVRQVFGQLRRRGFRSRQTAIVGDNSEGAELRRMFDNAPELGCRFAGYITVDGASNDSRYGDILCQLDDAVDTLTRRKITNVMIAASAVNVAQTSSLIRKLLKAGITVELSPTLPDIAVGRLSIRPLGRFPVVYLQPLHQSGWRSWAKRVFDFALSAIGLVVLALPLSAVCLAIKIDSKGPVFFRQTRVGRNGRLFDVIKFRTMIPDAHKVRDTLIAQNEADGPLFKIKDDPRVTRLGRILRKSSIDEFPQLWNVLCGAMSLVGPRPALPEEAALWSDDLRDRLRVQPGITGMWQVSGRSGTTFEEYSRLDLSYVDNWSLATDLSILGRTLPSVLFQRGAS